jgi:Zn-dependent protease
MNKHTKLKFLKVYRAPVYLHWSALLVMGGLLGIAFNSPILAVISICSYFGIILLHETGHAFVANQLGYNVRGIYLGFLHGICECDAPNNQKHKSLIAWGGVAAQLIVALPLIICAQIFAINEIYGLGPVVGFLGYISAIIALVNLAPSRELDGLDAWKLLPVLMKEHMARTKAKKKKSFKIVK